MPFKKKAEPLTLAGQEMKNLILKNAVNFFAQNSYHGTSMSEIASACGITKAGLYHYFKTKKLTALWRVPTGQLKYISRQTDHTTHQY